MFLPAFKNWILFSYVVFLKQYFFFKDVIPSNWNLQSAGHMSFQELN